MVLGAAIIIPYAIKSCSRGTTVQKQTFKFSNVPIFHYLTTVPLGELIATVRGFPRTALTVERSTTMES